MVRTYLRWGYTLLVGAGALKPRVDVIIQQAIDRGLIDGPPVALGRHDHPAGAIGAPTLTEVGRRRGDAPGRRRPVRAGRAGDQAHGLGRRDRARPPVAGDVHGRRHGRGGRSRRPTHGAFVTAHARSTEGVRLAVRNGVRIVHHATYLDDAAIAELTAARDDVWVCPGLHYLRAVVEGAGRALRDQPGARHRRLYPEELQASIDGYRKLHSNGVRIVAGGDFGHQWTRSTGTYAAELAAYVELLGFSPLEALLTATANAGRSSGERLGRIEEGYLADLVLVDGDPGRGDIRVLLDRAGGQGRHRSVKGRRRAGPGRRRGHDEGRRRLRAGRAAGGGGPGAPGPSGRGTCWSASRPAASATPT